VLADRTQDDFPAFVGELFAKRVSDAGGALVIGADFDIMDDGSMLRTRRLDFHAF